MVCVSKGQRLSNGGTGIGTTGCGADSARGGCRARLRFTSGRGRRSQRTERRFLVPARRRGRGLQVHACQASKLQQHAYSLVPCAICYQHTRTPTTLTSPRYSSPAPTRAQARRANCLPPPLLSLSPHVAKRPHARHVHVCARAHGPNPSCSRGGTPPQSGAAGCTWPGAPTGTARQS